MFLGKKRALLRRVRILAEKPDTLAPGSLLAAVEFAEAEPFGRLRACGTWR